MSENPLDYLDDLDAYMKWFNKVGPDRSTELLNKAIMEHMKQHGNRSVLLIAEKIAYLTARMEEFTDV